MTHAQALSKTQRPSTCIGTLENGRTTFSSDVYWRVYTCACCNAVVWTVEGKVHNWNGEHSKARAA